MARQDEVLLAVQKASELVREHPVESRTSFDIVGLLDDLDIPVMYQPLDGLQGAAVTVSGSSGVLIGAELPRMLQRFTLAHELGHILLGHENKFDDDVGHSHRAANTRGRPTAEVAADTFAAELLGSRELIQANAKRQGWSPNDLQRPGEIYQLALRLGLSFQATCWALVEHNVLPRRTAYQYTDQDGIVKQAKLSLIPEDLLTNPWADVWVLREGDAGLLLEASEEDVFVINLEEKSASGFLWELTETNPSLRVLGEKTDFAPEYGSPSDRTIYLTLDSSDLHVVTIEHKRPWNGEIANEIQLSIDNLGREKAGFPRRVRQNSLSEVTA